MKILRTSLALAVAAVALSACESEPSRTELGFLAGTEANPHIGLVVNSTDKALTVFRAGAPSEIRQTPFGASTQVTPTSLAVSGTRAAVPLGNAASVALVDLTSGAVLRHYIARSGNLSAAAFAPDGGLLTANLIDDWVGRVAPGQTGDSILTTRPVAPAPSAVVVSGNRALVVSSNLDESYSPLGPGVVTAVDAVTLQVLGTVETGGNNPTAAALGPDGLLYVVNTEDYTRGSIAVIDPRTLTRREVITGAGAGPGGISLDANGRAYVSGFYFGTLVYDTRTKQWIRGIDNPVCAPLPGGGCRGAFDAATDASGTLYQTFFGSAKKQLAPYVFVYRAGTFELTDSISVGRGPTSIQIRRF